MVAYVRLLRFEACYRNVFVGDFEKCFPGGVLWYLGGEVCLVLVIVEKRMENEGCGRWTRARRNFKL